MEVLRHTAAHVLAQAVCRLYGPGVQYTIGPALTDDFQYGFYYDFDLPRPISTEDLPAIEAEMKKIISEKLGIERVDLSAQEARQQMLDRGQAYKGEMIDDLIATGGTMMAGKKLLEKLGARVMEGAAIVDLPELGGSDRLRAGGLSLFTLVDFSGH